MSLRRSFSTFILFFYNNVNPSGFTLSAIKIQFAYWNKPEIHIIALGVPTIPDLRISLMDFLT